MRKDWVLEQAGVPSPSSPRILPPYPFSVLRLQPQSTLKRATMGGHLARVLSGKIGLRAESANIVTSVASVPHFGRVKTYARAKNGGGGERRVARM